MNRNMIAKAAALIAVGAAFSGQAVAADDTVTLTVTGTVTPAPCTAKFANGTIDYGTIDGGTLSPTDYTSLGDKTDALVVTCGANSNAYVSVLDTKTASAITASGMKTKLGDGTLADTQVFGLGASGAANVGAYTIKMGQASVVTAVGGTPTVQPAVLSSTDKATWQPSTTAVAMNGNGTTYYTAGPAGSNPTPVAARSFNFPLTITAALNNTTDLPLSSNVDLAGSATFTVAYQ